MRPLFGESLQSAERIACIRKRPQDPPRLEIRLRFLEVLFQFGLKIPLHDDSGFEEDAVRLELSGQEVADFQLRGFPHLFGDDDLEFGSDLGCGDSSHVVFILGKLESLSNLVDGGAMGQPIC
jgi:hypothetical protein